MLRRNMAALERRAPGRTTRRETARQGRTRLEALFVPTHGRKRRGTANSPESHACILIDPKNKRNGSMAARTVWACSAP